MIDQAYIYIEEARFFTAVMLVISFLTLVFSSDQPIGFFKNTLGNVTAR